jgi:hypothetical protein
MQRKSNKFKVEIRVTAKDRTEAAVSGWSRKNSILFQENPAILKVLKFLLLNQKLAGEE